MVASRDHDREMECDFQSSTDCPSRWHQSGDDESRSPIGEASPISISSAFPFLMHHWPKTVPLISSQLEHLWSSLQL